MTVLIGFSCPEFAILGADGRGIAVNDPGDVDDNTQKLFKTGTGILGGAGRTDVTDAVANRLANCVPASNEETSEIVRAEINRLGLALDDPGLQFSCWLATYATPTEQGVQTRLALAERQTHYSFDAFHHNRVIILRPAGMSEAVGRQFRIKAQALLDQRTGNSPSEQHIPLCIQLIAELVTAISQANHTVGPRWSVGLHLARNNTTNISNVGDDVNAMRWH